MSLPIRPFRGVTPGRIAGIVTILCPLWHIPLVLYGKGDRVPAPAWRRIGRLGQSREDSMALGLNLNLDYALDAVKHVRRVLNLGAGNTAEDVLISGGG